MIEECFKITQFWAILIRVDFESLQCFNVNLYTCCDYNLRMWLGYIIIFCSIISHQTDVLS